ncbi:MAG: hypothetical protein AAF311_11035 [Pseudomonadota bacterium]
MMEFLLWSLIASVVLTLLFNLALLIFPRVMERFEERLAEAIEARAVPEGSGFRIHFPIKAMLVGSLLLTLLLNVGAVFAG